MIYDKQYNDSHKWLKRNFGAASKCENCGAKNRKRYEYSLLKGKTYEKKRENFWQLCKQCHVVYDQIIDRLTANKYRAVIAIRGDVKYEFPSLQEAEKCLGILRTSISNALGGRSLTAGGYKWTYA